MNELYCSFCDNEASYKTQNEQLKHPTFLCFTCAEVFEYGQINPTQVVTSLEDEE